MTAVVTGDVPMAMLDWALRYADLGLRVLPIQPGLKYPPMTAWEQAATTDHDIITSWFTQLYRGHGIGLAMGRGVFALDVDVSDGKPGRESLQRLLEQHGPLPACPEQVTGSGGTHFILGTPQEIRNNAGTRLGPGLDIRGDGGQIVVAPTIHPRTSMPYGWREGRAPWEIAIPRAPEWLLELLATPPATNTATTTSTPNTPTGLDDDSIAAWVNASRSWHQVLAADGWQQHSTHKGDTHWTRPGKDVRDGASAVLHEPDGPFVVFSTDPGLAPLHDPRSANRAGDGWSYSLFGYLAQTRHGGDRSACARQARLERINLTAPGHGDPAATVTVDAESDTANDWERVDLVPIATEIATGQRQREQPTVLAVDESIPLFYRGRINQIFGQSGDGKSWLGLAAVVDTINDGELAMIVDWEDNPDGIATRLLDLGLTPAQLALVDYRNPGSGLGSADALAALADASGRPYGCVIIDSTGEAMAAGGVDGNVDPEVAAWFRWAKMIARWPSRPAVILIDHIPKNPDAPMGAIGSQRKTAAVTGAAYRATQTQAFARGRPGRMRLTVAKDRLGNRAKNTTACEVEISPHGDTGIRLRFHLTEIQEAIAKGLPVRYTQIMEAVSRFVEGCPQASVRAITQAVGGKHDHIRDAIQTLVDEGHIVIEAGKHGALHHLVEVPFRAKDDDSPVLPTFDHRPRPDRVPTASRDAVQGADDRVPPRPTPYKGGTGRGQRSRPEDTNESDRVPGTRDAVEATIYTADRDAVDDLHDVL